MKSIKEKIFNRKTEIAEKNLNKKGFFEKISIQFNKKINQISNTETIQEFKTIFNLVRDWYNGDYKDVDKKTIISLLGAIIYFITPIDAVPDFILTLGFLDDASILLFVYSKFKSEIDNYKEFIKSTTENKVITEIDND